MEVIAAAKQVDTHGMMFWGFIGYVGEGKGWLAAPSWTRLGHFIGRGVLQVENMAGMLLCSPEGPILGNLLQHKVNNSLWSWFIS